jgi:NAD(P) transhydrogenase subunit alpha
MSAEYQQKQAELTASHIAKQDIVITTALIPGRPAPKLVSRAMVESMAPGSVLVDLAAERGGNIELTEPGNVTTTPNGVTIVAYTNVPGRLASSASQLFSRNLYAFVETLFDKKTKEFSVNWDDELVKATLLTRDGAVVHPSLAAAATAAVAPAAAPVVAPVDAASPAAEPAAKPARARKPAASSTPTTSEPTEAETEPAAKRAPRAKPAPTDTPADAPEAKAPAKRTPRAKAPPKTPESGEQP